MSDNYFVYTGTERPVDYSSSLLDFQMFHSSSQDWILKTEKDIHPHLSPSSNPTQLQLLTLIEET